MLWINFLFLALSVSAAELPKFLTKHSPETLRHISLDGRYAYVQKKPGVLGLVSSFRSIDFLTQADRNDFLVRGSRFKKRLVIESIPHAQTEMSLIKNHKIFVVDYGNTVTREVGSGREAKLHLRDEWISYYDIFERKIHIQNLVTQKKYEIKLSQKPNPFFVPEVELVSARTVLYSDINESGTSALISFDLQNQKSVINYKASQSGTRLELCQGLDYLAVGEFPYDGVKRGSKIQIARRAEIMNLSAMSTLYNSVEQDLGNMLCLPNNIYFIKTVSHDERLGHKITEAAKLEIKDQKLTLLTDLKHVAQLLNIDGRVLIPLRGEFFVLEGQSNLSEDILRPLPAKEELQIDL